MKRAIENTCYYLIFLLWWLLSLLPLRLLYGVSDLLFYLIYHLVRYRKSVVRRNLRECFTDLDEASIRHIERGFYHFFCDYIVETLKMFSLSPAAMRRRIQFEGLDEIKEISQQRNVVVYLGHYCNWEWVSSLPLHFDLEHSLMVGQVYHALENKTFDRLLLRMRGRFGATSIEMTSVLRELVNLKQMNRHFVIGFISDQAPRWRNTHFWTEFLNHKTAVFTGAESIARHTDAAVYYLAVERPKRGYYKACFVRMAAEVSQTEQYEITSLYASLLEGCIKQAPQYWLWSHNRWKRTYERWCERKGNYVQKAK